MSFIVKGIDLPKDETITIHYANKYGEMETVFVDKSDIVQIPKGHGSLKDVDKIKLMARLGEVDIDRIDEAPTIIEAEE